VCHCGGLRCLVFYWALWFADNDWGLSLGFGLRVLLRHLSSPSPAESLPQLPQLKWLDVSFNSLQNLPVFPSHCPLEHLDLQSNLLDGTCCRSFEQVSQLLHLRLQVRELCLLFPEPPPHAALRGVTGS